MSELEKQDLENKVWSILKGYESIYTRFQPTLSYSSITDTFCMRLELLNELPLNVRTELLNLVKVCP